MSTHPDVNHYAIASGSTTSAASAGDEDDDSESVLTANGEYVQDVADVATPCAEDGMAADAQGSAGQAHPGVGAAPFACSRGRRPRKNPHPKYVPPGSRTEEAQLRAMRTGTLPGRCAPSPAIVGAAASPAWSSSPPTSADRPVVQPMAEDSSSGAGASGALGSHGSPKDESAAPAEAAVAGAAWPAEAGIAKPAAPAGDAVAEAAWPAEAWIVEIVAPAEAAMIVPAWPPMPGIAESAALADAIMAKPTWPCAPITDGPAASAGIAKTQPASPSVAFGEPAVLPSVTGAGTAAPGNAIKTEHAWPPAHAKTETIAPATVAKVEPAWSHDAVKAEAAAPATVAEVEPAWSHDSGKTESAALRLEVKAGSATPEAAAETGLAAPPGPCVVGPALSSGVDGYIGVSRAAVSQATTTGAAESATPAGPVFRTPAPVKSTELSAATRGRCSKPPARPTAGETEVAPVAIDRAMVYISGCAVPPVWAPVHCVSTPDASAERVSRPAVGSGRPFLVDTLPAVACNLTRTVIKTGQKPGGAITLPQPVPPVTAACVPGKAPVAAVRPVKRLSLIDRLFGDVSTPVFLMTKRKHPHAPVGLHRCLWWNLSANLLSSCGRGQCCCASRLADRRVGQLTQLVCQQFPGRPR